MLEYSRKEIFTSTGATAWEDAHWAKEHGFYFETAAASTCQFQVETRMNGGTVTSILGSTLSMDASSQTTMLISGALEQVRVRVPSMTGTFTVLMRGNS